MYCAVRCAVSNLVFVKIASQIETMLSKRILLLLVKNFKFLLYRVIKPTVWCCTVKTCSARIFTLGHDKTFSRKIGTQNHEAVSKSILIRQKINNSVKRKQPPVNLCVNNLLIHQEISLQIDILDTLTVRDLKYLF